MTQMMNVKLADLKDNPMRNFEVDPIDQTVVERLKVSITEDGFWGGVVVGQTKDGDLFIVAGHHRVRAALAAGETEATLFVRHGLTDGDIIRIYSRENATQRGSSPTALLGSVASALEFVIERAFSPEENSEVRRVRDLLEHKYGIGASSLMPILGDIASHHAVEQQTQTLKASGDYSSIIRSAKRRVKDRGIKPRDLNPWEPPERTFNLRGTAAYFDTDAALSAFRELVTKETVRRYLPLHGQPGLAADLRKKADAGNRQMSVSFVQEHTIAMIADVRGMQRKLDDKATAELAEEADLAKLEHYMSRFLRYNRGIVEFGEKLHRLLQKNEEIAGRFKVTPRFVEGVRASYEVVRKLSEPYREPLGNGRDITGDVAGRLLPAPTTKEHEDERQTSGRLD